MAASAKAINKVGLKTVAKAAKNVAARPAVKTKRKDPLRSVLMLEAAVELWPRHRR